MNAKMKDDLPRMVVAVVASSLLCWMLLSYLDIGSRLALLFQFFFTTTAGCVGLELRRIRATNAQARTSLAPLRSDRSRRDRVCRFVPWQRGRLACPARPWSLRCG